MMLAYTFTDRRKPHTPAQSPQNPEIVVTARKYTRKGVTVTATYTGYWWYGFPYKPGPSMTWTFTFKIANPPGKGFCSNPVNGGEVASAAKEGAEGGFALKAVRVIGAGAAGTLAGPEGTVGGIVAGLAGETAAGAGVGAAVNYANQACGG